MKKEALQTYVDRDLLLSEIHNHYPCPDEVHTEENSVIECPECGCSEMLCGFNGVGCTSNNKEK